MTVLVGGVGQLFQGDADIARHVVERLSSDALGAEVLVEELSYGAVAVAQRLEDVRPAALVLVGAAARGRPPGTVERRVIEGVDLPASELQRAVGEAVTGYVTLDLVVEVAYALGALPRRTVAIELEPVREGPSEHLSPQAAAAIDDVVALVRAELSDQGVTAPEPG